MGMIEGFTRMAGQRGSLSEAISYRPSRQLEGRFPEHRLLVKKRHYSLSSRSIGAQALNILGSSVFCFEYRARHDAHLSPSIPVPLIPFQLLNMEETTSAFYGRRVSSEPQPCDRIRDLYAELAKLQIARSTDHYDPELEEAISKRQSTLDRLLEAEADRLENLALARSELSPGSWYCLKAKIQQLLKDDGYTRSRNPAPESSDPA